MKRKGFTLIELLAVIVVLAIIALIATPIVMNVIKDSKKGATERSAERYLDAVETAVATDKLKEGTVLDGVYTVDADGNLVLGDKTLTVEVNGDKPAAGSKVAIQNGQVVPTGTSMTIGDYTVTINDKGSATAVAKGDVVASTLCTAAAPSTQPWYDPDEWAMSETTAGVQATEAAPYAAGAVYSCELGDGVSRTFYVLGTDGDNVKLIMNENLGNTVAWITQDDYETAGGTAWDVWADNNTFGPVTANAYLASQTNGWTKISQSQITLPDAQDIADAMGDTAWNDASYTEKVGPTWLWVNFDRDNGPIGYWTSTPYSDYSGYAWRVDSSGYLYYNFDYYVATGDFIGVRPVITISKSNMSL